MDLFTRYLGLPLRNPLVASASPLTSTIRDVRRLADAGIFRFEPKSHKFDIFVSYGFANPWGQYFDRWGQNYIADASGGSA